MSGTCAEEFSAVRVATKSAIWCTPFHRLVSILNAKLFRDEVDNLSRADICAASSGPDGKILARLFDHFSETNLAKDDRT